MKPSRTVRIVEPRPSLGWREWVALPRLGLDRLKVKIDTGARTTALHAEEIEEDGEDTTFVLPFLDGRPRVRARRVDTREIRNTSGIAEERHVIRTPIVVGRLRYGIEVSLASRANMAFPMILGRTAMRGGHFLVDPARSFLQGEPRSPRRRQSP